MSRVDIVWREEVAPSDEALVGSLCRSSGFFYEEEIEVAEELVRERLDKGPASGYHFIFAETEQATLGYACYGPIACTRFSWDIFWVAVDQVHRGQGVGKRLMGEVEARISRLGGQRLYVETSSRRQYQPTRAFYEAIGYRQEAFLEDFYAPGDGKIVLVKTMASVIVSFHF
jgi:ribosomal protein S18 acetylase RimI-like enzyme